MVSLMLPRRGYLYRSTDISHITGTGVVADVVQFANGVCVLHWREESSLPMPYMSIEHVLRVHGHDGATVVIWYDLEEDAMPGVPIPARIQIQRPPVAPAPSTGPLKEEEGETDVTLT